MSGSATYVLKGYGRIEPGWMQDCFRLFKERSVNIRRLVLMKTEDPDCFSMLEIQFVLTPDQIGATFLTTLEERLSALSLSEKTLTPA